MLNFGQASSQSRLSPATQIQPQMNELNRRILSLGQKVNQLVSRYDQLKDIQNKTRVQEGELKLLPTLIENTKTVKSELEKQLQEITGLDEFSRWNTRRATALNTSPASCWGRRHSN